MAKEQKTIIVAAGGTGGHLFPAEALAAELEQRGFSVHLFTDERARRFVSYFASNRLHVIPSATIKGKNPIRLLQSLWQLYSGLRHSKQILRRLQPHLVVGFGGYPTLPPLIAATQLKIPTLIHEQNAVMGRANRFLSRRVNAIAGGFLEKKGRYADKITITGNPLRADIIKAASCSYPLPTAQQTFNLLIFGGSQGASFFSKILPQALSLMPPMERGRLQITQQARAPDVDILTKSYQDLAVEAEIASFFSPIADRIAKAHLIIARAGASTVAEIAAIGRPSLLIPYPGALDHDQAANAQCLAAKGGAHVVQERDLDAEKLRNFLDEMMKNPDKLSEMAGRAKQAGQLQATQNLAKLAEQLTRKEKIDENAA